MYDDIISFKFIEIGFCARMNSHGRGIDSCVGIWWKYKIILNI